MYNNDEFIAVRRILHLSNLLINNRNDELKKHGITFVQAETLIYFDRIKGAKAMDLKVHLNISHQAARSIVERLCRKNYLYAEVSSEDARAKNIYLTAPGQRVCDELKKLGNVDGYQLLRDISEEERKLLLELLKRMTENIT